MRFVACALRRADAVVSVLLLLDMFFSFRTDNPNGKLLPLDTIRSWVAQAATQQKKANRQRPSGPAPAAAAARHPP
jgi:hypothetical protein